jgi:hypothetical protein
MGIDSASIAIDGTVGMTGGTATGVKVKGSTLTTKDVILDDSSEFIDQTKISFSIKDPKPSVSAPNGYTQGRASVALLVPLALDNGAYTTNTLRLELSCDHETTDAEIESMLVIAAQLLSDSDFSDFWKSLTIS